MTGKCSPSIGSPLTLAPLAFALLFASVTSSSHAGPPLHAFIDSAIEGLAKGPVAELCSDAEFQRRIYLDLAGRIPAANEARQFLADKTPTKRQKLIDRLLGSPQFPRRMREAFTVMLLERRPGKTVPDKQWNEFLERSFVENKPWDKLVAEILAADGLDAKTSAGIRFFVDGGRNNANQLTRDVGRLFLGMDLQCAQCHDHPSIETYKQAHYFGLFAFMNTSKLQANKYFIAGPTAKKIEFQSVFDPDNKQSTAPWLPDGKEIELPKFEKGQEFSQPAKDGKPAIPKFRPRQALSRELASAKNRRFVRNSVNRFWFLMMGRGLVHPLDLLHKDNPPSHPKLLEKMANAFVAHKFDVRWLMRELALSRAYQRSSLLPQGVEAKDVRPESYRVAQAKPLSAEQMAWSLLQATGNLKQVQATAVPQDSKFTYKDYINGRIDKAPDNMKDIMTFFAGVYGNPAGEAEVEFAPSMEHSLFLMHERLVQAWLKPKAGNLLDRLTKLKAPKKIAQELYLSVLARQPDDEEQAELATYLNLATDRRGDALAELAWALLASSEFRLNH